MDKGCRAIILQEVNEPLQREHVRENREEVPVVLSLIKSLMLLTFLLAHIFPRVVLKVSLCSKMNCSTDPETAISCKCYIVSDFLSVGRRGQTQ
jgi:hypothetical protein